jgi:hypothetical protein
MELLISPLVDRHAAQRIMAIVKESRSKLSGRLAKELFPTAASIVVAQEIANPPWAGLK